MTLKIYLISMITLAISWVDQTMEETSMEKTSHSIPCLRKLHIMLIVQQNLAINTNTFVLNCLMTLINGGRVTMIRKAKPNMMGSLAQTMN